MKHLYLLVLYCLLTNTLVGEHVPADVNYDVVVTLGSDPEFGRQVLVTISAIVAKISPKIAALIDQDEQVAKSLSEQEVRQLPDFATMEQMPIMLAAIDGATLRMIIPYLALIHELTLKHESTADIYLALAKHIETNFYRSNSYYHPLHGSAEQTATDLLKLYLASDDLKVDLLRDATAAIIARHLDQYHLYVREDTRQVDSPIEEWGLLSTDLIVRIVANIPNLFLSEDEIRRNVIRFDGHIHKVYGFVFSPEKDKILSASADRTARIWDVRNGKQLRMLSGHTRPVLCARYSHDGKRVVTASTDNTARIWNVATGDELLILQGHTKGVTAALFADNDHTVFTASVDTTVRMWQAKTGRMLRVMKGHRREVTKLVLSHQGSFLVSASADSTARVWNAKTGKLQRVLRGQHNGILDVAISEDDMLIATAAGDGTVWLHDAASGVVKHMLEGHAQAVNAIAFSSGGKYLASASDDRTACIWEVASGVLKHRLIGHTQAVTAVNFAFGAHYVATGSADTTVRIWDVSTGAVVRMLYGHRSRISQVLYSPNSRSVISSSFDDTLRKWPLRYTVDYLTSTDIDWDLAWPRLVRKLSLQEKRAAAH